MNRKPVGVAASVALALIGTLVLVSYVKGAEERAEAGEATVKVLVVTDPVPKGTPAADISGNVVLKEVPASLEAEGSLNDLAEVKDRVLGANLVPGEQVVATRFVTVEEARRGDVPKGLLQVTVSLDPQRAVGGQIEAGDTVGVVASFAPFELSKTVNEDGSAGPPVPDGTKTANTTHLILHKVLVTGVQVEQLPKKTDDKDGEADAGRPTLAPTGNLLVTLALDAGSVERVVFAAEWGKLWLSAEPSDAVESGTRVQTRGTVYE